MPPVDKRKPGDVFGRLTLVSKLDRVVGQLSRWNCKCSCGTECVRDIVYLSGKTRAPSCGCWRHQILSAGATKRATRHGCTGTPEHRAWLDMKCRCSSESHACWHHYGGRGIRVCPEWMASFEAFLDHIGPRPSKTHSLDRVDNDGNYEPGNVRWATRKQQNSNMRRSLFVTVGGVTKTANDWAIEAGLDRGTVMDRIRRGVPPELAVQSTRVRLVKPGPKKKVLSTAG